MKLKKRKAISSQNILLIAILCILYSIYLYVERILFILDVSEFTILSVGIPTYLFYLGAILAVTGVITMLHERSSKMIKMIESSIFRPNDPGLFHAAVLILF